MNRFQTSTPLQNISVDVRLCGSIPRKDLVASEKPSLIRALGRTKPVIQVRESDSSLTSQSSKGFQSLVLRNRSNIMRKNDPPAVEPPHWAVPACGQTTLEPVCESLGRQRSIDLTQKPFFQIGRAPNSDIHLVHATSSRKHAMLFHHSNGSCYIIDCGSAHGTYVNGSRVNPPGERGVVIPHKVRRGAMIRFGGPGAPCFVLKSFSYQIEDVMVEPKDETDSCDLIRRNTRINALGKTSGQVVVDSVLHTIDEALLVTRKRSCDSMDTSDPYHDEFSGKRRCMSPPLTVDSSTMTARLVSPEATKPTHSRRVSFSQDPPQLFYPSLVTPDELSSSEDDDFTE